MVLMKALKQLKYLLLPLALFLFIFLPKHYASASEDVIRVWDHGNCFSPTEYEQLENLAEKYSTDSSYEFLIVTTTSRAEYDYTHSTNAEDDCKNYAFAFYEKYSDTYSELSKKGACVLVLDLSENRYAFIQAFGELKESGLLKENRRKSIIEKITEDFSSDNRYEGCKTYFDTASRYVKIKPSMNPNSIFLKLWFQLLLAVVVGFLIVLFNAINMSGKMTVNDRTYLDENRSRLIGKHDHYIRTSVTKTKRSSDNDSGNSSGGGDSGGSGGHF